MSASDRSRLIVIVSAALVALSGIASGGVLSDLGAIPNPFSPNGDGVFDSTAVHYALSDTAAIVVTVADLGMAGIDTVWAGWEGVGEHRHWWNARAGGSPVPDGDYYFVVVAIPETGGLDDERVLFSVDTVPPAVAALLVTPSRISPDADGVGDSLLVSARVDLSSGLDHVLLSVVDADGQPVRNLVSETGADSIGRFWDGADDSGARVPDGLYGVRVDARDDAGNASSASALVDVDTSPPWLSAQLSDAEAGEVRVATPVASLSGSAYDRAGVVAVELSLDAENWIELDFSGPDSVYWRHDLACSSCVVDAIDERVPIYVRARDGTPTSAGQGYVNTEDTAEPILSFDVVFDVAGPIHESTYVKSGDGTFVPGGTVKISSEWDEGGYRIEADLSLVDSEFDTANVEWSGSSSGLYSVEYEISAASTLVPVYDAAVRITATDRFGRSSADSSLTISVLPVTAGPSGLTLSANAFTPAAGEKLEISFGAGVNETTVRIYNMAGTLVRTLEPGDSPDARWDGRNGEGELVASGVYLLLIETNLGDATRKVAVVK